MTTRPDEIGRTLGIDFGTKRIGVAAADSRGVLASPLTVVQRSGSIEADHRKLLALAAEEEVVRIVVGMPIALDGTQGIAAKAIADEVAVLSAGSPVRVLTWDERMTSAAAHKGMQSAQRMNEKKRRQQIDMWAAAVMLQGWLDAQGR